MRKQDFIPLLSKCKVGGEFMKKYSVNVKFNTGQEITFKTDTNVKLASPIIVNDQPMIFTENEYAINLRNVKEIKQLSLG